MGDKDVRPIKISELDFGLSTCEFGTQPNVDMDIELIANVLELVTMSEERIVEEKNGSLEKAYASARNSHLGCMHRLIRNCHLPELFNFSSRQSQMQHLKERNAGPEQRVKQLMLENG